MIPFPKIVMNFPRTCVKLHCKGEPYRFSGLRVPARLEGRGYRNRKETFQERFANVQNNDS